MTRQRLITATVLITVVLSALLLLPMQFFPWISGAIVLLAAWEWSGLSGFSTKPQRAIYTVVIGISMAVIAAYPQWGQRILLLGMAWWLMAVLVLAAFILGAFNKNQTKRSYFLMLGLIILDAFWVGLSIIYQQNVWALLVLLTIVYSADSGAYFVGRRWGRARLAPTLSPGKTWMGLVGGLAAATLVSFIFCLLQAANFIDALSFILLAQLIVLLSVVGDLFESLAKRLQGVKDSGRCLPGHGGVLDRIDSLVAATPLFAMSIFYYYR